MKPFLMYSFLLTATTIYALPLGVSIKELDTMTIDHLRDRELKQLSLDEYEELTLYAAKLADDSINNDKGFRLLSKISTKLQVDINNTTLNPEKSKRVMQLVLIFKSHGFNFYHPVPSLYDKTWSYIKEGKLSYIIYNRLLYSWYSKLSLGILGLSFFLYFIAVRFKFIRWNFKKVNSVK